MAKQPAMDWLEPPAWWRKWRPLRWLGALLVLIALWAWLGPDERPAPPARRVAAAPPPVQAPAIDSAAAPAAEPAAAAPAPAAEPAASEAGPMDSTTPSPPAAAAGSAAAESLPASEPASGSPAVAAATAPTRPAAPQQLQPESQRPSQSQPQVEAAEAAGPGTSASEIAAFTQVEQDRVRLLGNYRSYASVDDVVVGLERAGFVPIVESRHPDVPRNVPPRNLDVVVVHQYRHWDVPGRLELQFFNDRLYQTEFEPEDADRYVVAQRRELPQLKRSPSGRAELVTGALRIASSLELATSEVGRKLGTRPFLLWQDRRLVRQRDEWDRRFALAAAQGG